MPCLLSVPLCSNPARKCARCTKLRHGLTRVQLFPAQRMKTFCACNCPVAIRACSLPSSGRRNALKRSLAHPDTASDTGVAVRSRSSSKRAPAIRHPNHYVLSGRDGVPHVKAGGVADHPTGAVLSSIKGQSSSLSVVGAERI